MNYEKEPIPGQDTVTSYITRHAPIMAKDNTLLDHFAGLAMQGLLDRSPRDEWGNVPDAGTSEIAEEAYQYAAAMIAERKRLMEQP